VEFQLKTIENKLLEIQRLFKNLNLILASQLEKNLILDLLQTLYLRFVLKRDRNHYIFRVTLMIRTILSVQMIKKKSLFWKKYAKEKSLMMIFHLTLINTKEALSDN